MTFDARKAKLLAPGERIIIDDCPGLRLEASTAGRAWIYRFKSPLDGKMRQVKIGQWPAMSYSMAMESWTALRDQRQAGSDPAQDRKKVRQAEKEALAVKRSAQKTTVYTVAKLAEDFCTGYVDRNRQPKGRKETRRLFEKMLGDMANQPAATVTRADAFDLINSYMDTPVVCASLKRELGAAWDYALDAGRLPSETPNWWRLIMVRRIKSKGKIMQGKHVGTAKRVLNSEEVRTLIKWLPNFPRTIDDALTLYLWTATRGTEIVAMRGDEIFAEEDGLWWVVPKVKTKNERYENATDLRVPLVGRAYEIVQRRIAMYGKDYLFPRRKGKDRKKPATHIEQKCIQVDVWTRQPYSKTRPDHIRLRLPVTHWAPHDLRRTSRTVLAALGCPNEVGEAILGHMQEGIIGTYNLHTYDKERRHWLTLLDAHYESLVK